MRNHATTIGEPGSNASKLQAYWDKSYESTATPFDIEAPDEWIAALEWDGKIKGNVLDAGCGPGRTSIYLAKLGYSVLGGDISINAIERAQTNAARKGSTARFVQANLCELGGYDSHFDTVVDIGCFHSLLEDADRRSYAATLHRACRAGAVVYLRAFSEGLVKPEDYPGEHSPAMREEQIRAAFCSPGWVVKELAEKRIELFISADEKPMTCFWFAEIERAGV